MKFPYMGVTLTHVAWQQPIQKGHAWERSDKTISLTTNFRLPSSKGSMPFEVRFVEPWQSLGSFYVAEMLVFWSRPSLLLRNVQQNPKRKL